MQSASGDYPHMRMRAALYELIQRFPCLISGMPMQVENLAGIVRILVHRRLVSVAVAHHLEEDIVRNVDAAGLFHFLLSALLLFEKFLFAGYVAASDHL